MKKFRKSLQYNPPLHSSQQHAIFTPAKDIPSRHTTTQLGHTHSHTLNEDPRDQPTPNHTTRARISHSIIQRTRKTRQKTQHGKRNTEGGPKRELALELLLITQSNKRSLISSQSVEIGGIAIGHDRGDGGTAGIEGLRGGGAFLGMRVRLYGFEGRRLFCHRCGCARGGFCCF